MPLKRPLLSSQLRAYSSSGGLPAIANGRLIDFP
jgi:hypothetical protein